MDDDPAVGETLSAILRRNGYAVTCFAEGQSFLAAARARAPACVLLDVNLPGRSGLDILKNLNGEHYPVPILMISGVGDIPMAVEAIKYGALDFIEKPFRANTVSAAVQVSTAKNMIEGLGYRVLAARNGREALEILGQDRHIDLLFTDLFMPDSGMHGPQLVAEARGLRPELKVVYASGHLDYSVLRRGLDPEIITVSKPYRLNEVALKLREVLGSRKKE